MTSRLNCQRTNEIGTKLSNQVNNQSLIPLTEVIQLTLTLKMTTAPMKRQSTFTRTIILNLLILVK